MFDEYMLDIGFLESDIKTIKSTYPLNNTMDATLLFNSKNLYQYLKRNGFSNKDYISIIKTLPTLLSLSIENIKLKVLDLGDLGFHRLEAFQMVKNYPYLLEYSKVRIKNKIFSS